MVRKGYPSSEIDVLVPKATPEMLARRRELLSSLAGAWSKEEADRIEATLHEMFDRPEPPGVEPYGE